MYENTKKRERVRDPLPGPFPQPARPTGPPVPPLGGPQPRTPQPLMLRSFLQHSPAS